MIATLEEIEIPESDRSALRALFEQSSAYIVNNQRLQLECIDPGNSGYCGDRWKVQLALDQVVGALRGGDPGRTLDFAASPPLSEFLSRDQTVHAHLLALVHPRWSCVELIAYVEKCLAARPSAIGASPVQHRACGRFSIVPPDRAISASSGGSSVWALIQR